MTAMTTTSGIPHGRPFTVDDLEAMPDDGNRYELIDGTLIVSPAPAVRHQKVLLQVAIRLDAVCPDDLHVFPAPFAVRPSDDTELQPDVLVARDADLTDKLLPTAPVLAVEDGEIVKLFYSVRGGKTIYQFDRSGRYCYYYAHLDRYAGGLAEKQRVSQGEVIGYVGSTGNAKADAPHLHLAIFKLTPEQRWWEGTPIDPYPALTRQ